MKNPVKMHVFVKYSVFSGSVLYVTECCMAPEIDHHFLTVLAEDVLLTASPVGAKECNVDRFVRKYIFLAQPLLTD